jgi:hypothetical protein
LFDCLLDDEQALSLQGELASSLVKAAGYIQVDFTGSAGRTLPTLKRGPWLGGFTGLALNETLPVPDGAKRVRVVATALSSQPNTTGEWRVTKATLKSGIMATLGTPNGEVVSTGHGSQWFVQTISNSPAASAHIQLLNLEGIMIQQATLTLPAGGGRVDVSWPNLPVGYYDVKAEITANSGQSTTLHSSVAILPDGAPPHERRFGIDAALSWYGGPSDQIAQSIAMMQQAGIGSIRDRLRWSQVQTSVDKVNWGHYYEVASAVANAGLDEVQVFHDSPSWARSGNQESPDRHPPTNDVAAYAFGRAYANGLGKIVRNIEYWNEENSNFFQGYPYQYASGLKAFSAGVKSVDPNIRVLIGSAAGEPGNFFEEVYHNNINAFFDTRNQHYYGKNADIGHFVATQVADREQRAKIAEKSGWLTEMGYSLTRDAQGDWRKAEREQAEYLVKTYVAGFAAGYERVFFFFWRELIEDDFHTWGIIRNDYTPRPAYVALAVLTRQLAGATLMATETQSSNMTVYFRQPAGSYIAVSWGMDNMKRLGSNLQAKDIYGRPLNLTKVWPTDGKPILLSGITKLPISAQPVVTHSANLLPEAPLRVSATLSIANKSAVPIDGNKVSVNVNNGDTVVLSGRIFAPTALIDNRPLRVQCSSGAGLTPLTPLSKIEPFIVKEGTPFTCSFRATLSATGQSYIAINAEHGNTHDSSYIDLMPNAGNVVKNKTWVLLHTGSCLQWQANASRNVDTTLVLNPLPNNTCPSVTVINRVITNGETWVFPNSVVQGSDLSGSTGIQIIMNQATGVALPPTPLQLQLVVRSGGIWLVDLVTSDSEKNSVSGLFNLARPAPWARDKNERLDLTNVRKIMLGWGGYGGQVGQRYGFTIEAIKLFNDSTSN